MVFLRSALVRLPTEGECEGVALNYGQSLSAQVPDSIARHAAESVAFDLCGSTGGSLDWPDEMLAWKWPKLDEHMANLGTNADCAAFHLSRLMHTRVRAWVEVELSRFGPKPRGEERRARDLELARSRYDAVQTLDLQAFAQKIESAFEAESGSGWRGDPAANRAANKLVAAQEHNRRKSVDDFYAEAASFMRDRYTLEAEPCSACQRAGFGKRTITGAAKALPPFHLSCACKVRWAHEWVYDELAAGSHLLDAVEAWLASNVQGLSITPPAVKDLVEFERARMRDEQESGR